MTAPLDLDTYNWTATGMRKAPHEPFGVMQYVRAIDAAALLSECERLRSELRNIADADISDWDVTVRDQFRNWAQNRARAALARQESPAPCPQRSSE